MNWDVFWELLFLCFIVFPLLYIWGFALCDLFVRRDLGNIAKIVWLLAIIFLPIVGTLAYFVTRPVMPLPGAQSDQYLPGVLASLESLHNSGDLSDSEYERQRAEVTKTATDLTARGTL
jgi:hypothetical protein